MAFMIRGLTGTPTWAVWRGLASAALGWKPEPALSLTSTCQPHPRGSFPGHCNVASAVPGFKAPHHPKNGERAGFGKTSQNTEASLLPKVLRKWSEGLLTWVPNLALDRSTPQLPRALPRGWSLWWPARVGWVTFNTQGPPLGWEGPIPLYQRTKTNVVCDGGKWGGRRGGEERGQL